MKLSSCDVASYHVLWRVGQGEVCGCTWRVQTAWLSLGWETVLSSCMAHTSSGEAFLPVWVSSCWLIAITIASSLMGWCGLRQKWGYG